MQKALEQLKFAILMRNLRKTITLLLTVAFFYSAVGHAFVLHYCKTSGNKCVEASCCNEEENSSCNNDIQAGSENCCVISSEYLVNPFSVRQPVGFEFKKADFVSAIVMLFSAEPPVPLIQLVQTVEKDFIPPDKDFLASYQILLI